MSKQNLTSFQRVALMNIAFDNPAGNFDGIDIGKLRSQCKNIGHEYLELLKALGLAEVCVEFLRRAIDHHTNEDQFVEEPNVKEIRDGLGDIQVFAQGAQHMAGLDGDEDMDDIIDGVMTRFIKDDADKAATIAKHAAKGVTDVYFVGEYPTMVMKSGSDQPDAPKGKFLKSASYKDTVFRNPLRDRSLEGGWPAGQMQVYSAKAPKRVPDQDLSLD